MKNIKLIMVIEKSGPYLLGRVNYNNDLIIEEAENINELALSLKKQLHDFHGLDPENISFTESYDLTELFDVFSTLKISSVAELAGINTSLMRQYVTGIKTPKAETAKKIQSAIHKLANDLSKAQILVG